MWLKKIIWHYLGGWKYTIGFPQATLGDILAGKPLNVKWLQYDSKDRWFADPFILDVTDTDYFVLVEEMLCKKKKGVISKLTIDRESYKLKKREIVLEEDTHLSFPNILRDGKDVYIYPENCATNSLNLYKYDEEINKFVKIKKLAVGDYADSVYADLFGEKYIFTTKGSDISPSKLDVMQLNASNGLYEIVKTIAFDEKIARGAGAFFEYGGKTYRPAQECNVCYGHAVSIQEVEGNTLENLKYKEIVRLNTNNSHYELGMHTFNIYRDIVVVDAMGYKHNLARIFGKIKHILN